MNIFKLIIRSLLFYKKQQLAVLAGTILSTAVLTGALIIGDSVKGSLKQMVDLRLGKAKYALMTGDRFVRGELANELANDLKIDASPLLAVEGITINTENNVRLNKTKVYGIENSFWQFSDSEEVKLEDDEVLISQNIAERLNFKEGNELLLRIENAEVIPLNAPFASQENNSVSLRMKVKAILDENQLGRFSIRSDQKAPYNVFLSREVLAEKLDLNGLCNLILLPDDYMQDIDVEIINNSLLNVWQLEDISLKIKPLNEKGSYELVSDRIFIEDQITGAIEDLKIQNKPVLTYLVNEIQNREKSTPYSFVSATDQLFADENSAENEVIINSWLAEDLSAKKGDTLRLKYYIIGPLRKLQEESAKFVVKDIVPIENREDLKSLMPSFPGLSDAGHCREWETGVPINLDKIRDKDEDYWNEYKGTPKAYISINLGQKIWQNQFGKLTALRFDPAQISPSELRKKLISKLQPSDFNLTVQAVYDQGIAATVNAVDFGELFLSLSFFVIVAGVLLTVLLHTLNTESRSTETGIFAGLGFSKKMILKIRLGESLIIAVLGGILGAFVGILYNHSMLIGLNSVWYDVVRTSMISVFIKPATLFIGAFSGFLISLLSIYFVSRKKLKHPVAFLIKNISTSSLTKSKTGFQN
jgi:putative ABC transport system permease protein